jgi:predicted pyridoxine 5'-phosphate oxidase superfamily flavin-nucleotide-binding protein
VAVITESMRDMITTFNAGSVATVHADGTPSVSPKATFVVVNDTTIAFGNIRSPGTVANLAKRPAIEICFTDVLARKALRVTGTAKVIRKTEASADVAQAFAAAWTDYLDRISTFVVIDVSAVEEILSPAYDDGATEADLKAHNLAKLNAL